jgi:hypothetical protein
MSFDSIQHDSLGFSIMAACWTVCAAWGGYSQQQRSGHGQKHAMACLTYQLYNTYTT